ncbi:MAG: choice-of-anchor Q domain-containing protein, partial [Verrucomicrobiales bacterium]
TITNSTISNNLTRAISFFSAFESGNDSLSLTNVTIGGNSGSAIEIVANAGTMDFEYQNTIFTNNGNKNIDARGNEVLEGLSIVSLGNNLLDDTPEADADHPVASGDRRDTDPRVAPLGDYGGPTPTSPPLPGSPAIEGGGEVAGIERDQRGSSRIAGAFPDIGSVEAFPFSTLTLVDTADGDGIDDRVEVGLYGDTATAGAATDSDGDGSSDADEIANMTDPFDAGDFFRILSIVPATEFVASTNPRFEITIKSFPGLDYELELSSSLDFSHGANAPRVIEVVESGSFVETVEVEFEPGRDFLRANRK